MSSAPSRFSNLPFLAHTIRKDLSATYRRLRWRLGLWVKEQGPSHLAPPMRCPYPHSMFLTMTVLITLIAASLESCLGKAGSCFSRKSSLNHNKRGWVRHRRTLRYDHNSTVVLNHFYMDRWVMDWLSNMILLVVGQWTTGPVPQTPSPPVDRPASYQISSP